MKFNAFVNKDIYFGNVEKNVYYKAEESQPKFEESIAERTKMRRQKSDEENTVNELNKLIVKKDKSINKYLIKNILRFKV